MVPRDSAVLPGYIAMPIHRNHMEMTKFKSEDDPGFIAVVGELCRWIGDASQSSMADDGTMHGPQTQSPNAARKRGRSNDFAGDGQNKVRSRGNVTNQSGQNNVGSFTNHSGQVVFGNMNNHQSVYISDYRF